MQPDRPFPAAPSPHRILLADDSPSVRQLVRAYLLESGYEVDVVARGDEAVAAFDSVTYDLVLMDVEMPVMSGLHAAEAIRRLPGRAGATPIMALTANTDPSNRGACRDAGMNDFMIKPIRRDPLLNRVKHWLTDPVDTAPTQPSAGRGPACPH